MEQNDIVAQILAMIKGGGGQGGQMPLIQPTGMPGPPPGIRPQGPEMPEGNDLIALQLALGGVPDGQPFPMGMMGGADGGRTIMSDDPMAPGMDDPQIQQLIAQFRKANRPRQARPGYSDTTDFRSRWR